MNLRSTARRAALVTSVLVEATRARAEPPPLAYGLLAASRESDALAIAVSDGATTRVYEAADGAHFRLLSDLPDAADTQDMLFAADGSLVLAASLDTEGDAPSWIVVWRHGASASSWGPGIRLPGDHAVLARTGPHVVVTSEHGAWTVPADRGRPQRLARWSAPSLRWASLRETHSGWIDLLLPTVDYGCEGPEWLDKLYRIVVTSRLEAKLERVPSSLSAGEHYFVRGGDGTVYSTGELYYGDPPTTCQLRASGYREREVREVARPAMREGDCALVFGSLGRLSVLSLGDKVFSLTESTAHELGALEAGEEAVSVSPDRQGRALVLLRDGRLFRYTADGPRELLWRVPNDP